MVEVMVAAVILVVGVLALLSVLDVANATTATSRSRDVGTNVARQVTEAARSVPYYALTPQTIEDQLQEQPGLGSTSGDAWTLRRHDIDFTVQASVCAVDDPSDGTGPHDAGVYCADSAAAGTSDKNPDDYKRVTADLTWELKGREHHVHQVIVVNHPGSAGGPAVKTLTILAPASANVLSDLTGVGFSATTSSPASTVAFSVDGVATATANGSAMLWNFTWPISDLVDGTHLVTAQAFDTHGLSGATRSATVTLNRFVPIAVTGLAGGRNGSVVELEWLRNPERDVTGYRAYRGEPGLDQQLVCGLTRHTACRDETPPAGELRYFVVATDLSPTGEYRDGLPSDPITVLTVNHAPHPAQGLTASSDGDTTTLTWNASEPSDETHDAVAFYRIYRDGTGYADRYDRTGTSTELTFADGRTNGETHEYWVTAVNSQLAESAPVGPVTL
jgi:hypothetical protein